MIQRQFALFRLGALPFITTGVCLLLLCQCKNEGSNSHLQLFGKQKITLLDSTAATVAITTDEKEHFFEKVTILDMALQMKKPYSRDTSRAVVLHDYQGFLKEDVTNFKETEAQLLQTIFADIENWCNQISTDIFPKKIRLIKSKGRAYGDGVYFTRENCIVIPENELQKPDSQTLRAVLIHEIFHIYSRYHPNERNALYALIGFQQLDGDLIVPTPIQSRLLLNPDGVDMGYAIRLSQMPGDTLQAVPIITSNAPIYIPERKNYFDYIHFNVYPIHKQPDGSYFVIASTEGESPLHVNEQGDFFKQITDNTMYIIHPDEIMADNFKFLVLAQSGEEEYDLSRFSNEGQALIEKMAAVFRKLE